MDVNKSAVVDTECYWAPEINKPSDSSTDKPLLDWEECLSVSFNPFLQGPSSAETKRRITSLTKYISTKVIYLVPKFVGLI